MHDETVETYTNVYARWFAIISQFIVTASLCTLWRLQMTRYSQVLVHSTVVNSRLSHQYMSISPFLWGFTAGFLELFLGFLQFQLLFARSFPAFWLGLGAVLVISAVSTTFSRVFSGFWAGFGCCFGDFCSFSYFLPGLFRLLGWVWGAVLVISAVSATFCEASGIMVEAQHHKLTTTYWKKPLVSFNIKNTVIRNGNLYEPGPPAYTYVNLPLPCVHAGAFLRFMSIISYRILVAKRSDS